MGIGIDPPTQKLDVAGSIQLKGDLLPTTTYQNLGSAAKFWGNVHVSSIIYHSLEYVDEDEASNMLSDLIKNTDDNYIDKTKFGRGYLPGYWSDEKYYIDVSTWTDIPGTLGHDEGGYYGMRSLWNKPGTNLNYTLSCLLFAGKKLIRKGVEVKNTVDDLSVSTTTTNIRIDNLRDYQRDVNYSLAQSTTTCATNWDTLSGGGQYLRIPPKTKAQLQAITPTAKYQQYICSYNGELWVSSGTTRNAFWRYSHQ